MDRTWLSSGCSGEGQGRAAMTCNGLALVTAVVAGDALPPQRWEEDIGPSVEGEAQSWECLNGWRQGPGAEGCQVLRHRVENLWDITAE